MVLPRTYQRRSLTKFQNQITGNMEQTGTLDIYITVENKAF
uniref:Uncharacterized protein n=1 Tax=Zea mays TaxID=4577 RepID=C0PAX2_MAIZE|nr:unknown [Zea mays]